MAKTLNLSDPEAATVHRLVENELGDAALEPAAFSDEYVERLNSIASKLE